MSVLPLYAGRAILMVIMIGPALSMEATNNTQPPSESRSTSHSSPIWEPAIPAIVILAILCVVLYLMVSCHRRPFGEVIRPHVTGLLFGHIPTFGDGSTSIEMRERDVPSRSHI